VTGRPQADEAAPYYFTYIDKIPENDVVSVFQRQLIETMPFLESISEEKSLYRYAPDKWSIRQTLNHVTDCERVFLHRALWFGRGFDAPLPSYDQTIAAAGAQADRVSWAEHVREFRGTREASISFFRNLPEEAWMRKGVASDNLVTVRALAYMIAGHLVHHRAILDKHYL
jgi:uncharacterized damage-inducible protein DinB